MNKRKKTAQQAEQSDSGALAEALDLDRPIGGILDAILEKSGACRMSMVFHLDKRLLLAASADGNGCHFYEDSPLEENTHLPIQMIRSVFESGQSQEQTDVGMDGVADFFCRPLSHHQMTTGVLYLEADTPHTFGDAHKRALNTLIDEAATSLEHTRLYAEMSLLNRNLQREIAGRNKIEQEMLRQHDQLEVIVKERTEELEQAQIELMRKERLATLGQLIATVSHELRNPLGTVRGSVFIISQRLLGKDLGVERALDRAERNIVRCDRIIEDLLDYTRTQDLEFIPTHLDRWLNGALEEYQFPGDVSVHVALGVNLEVPVEQERLRRCLINLLNNACDAMKTKKGEAAVREKHLHISSQTTESRVEIVVRDGGEGIARENLEKIFEPLFSTKSFGVGLGLPTVQQVMEQHGGGLEIESELGVGTTALLWLPLPETK